MENIMIITTIGDNVIESLNNLGFLINDKEIDYNIGEELDNIVNLILEYESSNRFFIKKMLEYKVLNRLNKLMERIVEEGL